jgi:cytochrome c oxidase assembly protein subunit 15
MTKSSKKPTNLFPLALVTLIGLFLVNTLGFIDTQTGSALGCGREWPLCKGEVIPSEWDLYKAIEYIHRLSVLADLILLLILFAATWRRYRTRKDLQMIMGMSFFAFAGEGALGAMSVFTHNPPYVLALHMGMALIAFTSLYLWTAALRQIESGKEQRKFQDSARVKQLAKWTWGTFLYSFLVVYFGAYVTFSGAGAYFQGWPFPTESFSQAQSHLIIDILHRLMALILFLLILKLNRIAYPLRSERKDLWTVSLQILFLVVLQILSGALLILTKLHLVAFLLHVSIVTFMVGSLSLLGLKASSLSGKERIRNSTLPHKNASFRSSL